MILDLNNPEKSDVKYEYLLLPDGQPHIKIEEYLGVVEQIKCSITSMNDLGKLLVAIDALSRIHNGFATKWALYIPYFLGARQDKEVWGEAVTCQMMCDIINNAIKDTGCNAVHVLHPHSNAISLGIGKKFVEVEHVYYVEQAIKDFEPDFLIIPDLGAAKNAQKYDRFDLPQIQCGKVRDPKTGNLSGFKVYDEVPIGKKGLVCDDIADKAGTHMGIAGLFPDCDIALYATHGILGVDMKRAGELRDTFTKIYTTDSYRYSGIPMELEGKLPWVIFEV